MLPGFSTSGMTVALTLLARPAVSAGRLTPLSSPLSLYPLLCPSVLPSVGLRAVVGLPGPCVTSECHHLLGKTSCTEFALSEIPAWFPFSDPALADAVGLTSSFCH